MHCFVNLLIKPFNVVQRLRVCASWKLLDVTLGGCDPPAKNHFSRFTVNFPGITRLGSTFIFYDDSDLNTSVFK